MASWLSGLHPVRAFPDYHGPYSVGTIDVEIPVAHLPAASEEPEGAQPTIAFRMFYPCIKPTKTEIKRPVHWIPHPQRIHVASILEYVGVGPKVSGAASFLLRQLYWIKLPAYRNAKLLDPPTSNGRWPVTLFSHGLAGGRNSYSQICGDLASYGSIVLALDHRDGSSPIQYVRATEKTEAHTVEPVNYPHSPMTKEVYQGRDDQLRIRLWEVCMVYEALKKIDSGYNITNLDDNTSRSQKERTEVLWQFNDKMDVLRPGEVSWAGHSFGAATMLQLLKSIFYHKDRTQADDKPLIKPNDDAAVVQQIAPESPLLLLDMWCTPLKSPFQTFLAERPLPSYAVGGPNGANVLSVVSESFNKWQDNLNYNKAAIARPSRSRRPSRATTQANNEDSSNLGRLSADAPAPDSGYASSANSRTSPMESDQPVGQTKDRLTGPHIFYVGASQHFNQSDFGVLFPWIAGKFAKAEEPERILELNIRAMAQTMREGGIELGGADDRELLDPKSGIRRWVPIAIDEEDKKLVKTSSALDTVDRKLSI